MIRTLKNLVLFIWTFVCMFWITCAVAFNCHIFSAFSVISVLWLIIFFYANAKE